MVESSFGLGNEQPRRGTRYVEELQHVLKPNQAERICQRPRSMKISISIAGEAATRRSHMSLVPLPRFGSW